MPDVDLILRLATQRDLVTHAAVTAARERVDGPLSARELLVSEGALEGTRLAELAAELRRLLDADDLEALCGAEALEIDETVAALLTSTERPLALKGQRRLMSRGWYRPLAEFLLSGGQPLAEETLSDSAMERLYRIEDDDGTPPTPPGYELGEEIGAGGAGRVFAGRQLALDRPVAIKFLHGRSAPVAVARFRREAHLLARLSHPGIVEIHEVGRIADFDFIAMELVDGGTLDEWAIDHTSRATRLDLFVRVAEAIGHAHRRGVLHRDIKPANILVDRDGNPRVLDFGLSRLDDDEHELTRTDAVMGTPYYMSPEQVRGEHERIDHATDVFALGIILYELLTDHRPFDGQVVADIYFRIMDCDPPPLRRVPRDLDAIVRKAMAPSPERRYPDASALAEDLVRFRAARPVEAQPPSWAYSARKWIRRNKITTTILATLIPALLAGGTYHYLEVRRERDRVRRAFVRVKRETHRRATAERDLADSEGLRKAIEDVLRLESSNAPLATILARLAEYERTFDDPDLHSRRGWILIRRGRNAEAMDSLQRLLARAPDHADTLFLLGRAWRQLGDDTPNEAAKRAEAIRRGDTMLAHHVDARAHYFEALYGKAEQRDARLMLALAAADKALAANPRFYWARLQRGEILRRLGRITDALAEFEQTIREGPAVHEAIGARAELLFELGRTDEALAGFAEAVRRLPDKPALLSNYAGLLRSAGKITEARTMHSRAVAAAPWSSKIWFNRGQFHMGIGRWPEAVADFSRSIELAPTFARGIRRRAKALLELKRYEEARTGFEMAAKLDPRDKRTHLMMARLENECHRLEQAADSLRRVLAIDPDDADGLHGMSVVLINQGKRDEALALADRAVAAAPDAAPFHVTRARLLRDLGRTPEALAALSRALRADPKYTKAYYRRAVIYANTDRTDEALADIERAIRVGSRDPRHHQLHGKLLAMFRRGDEALAAFDRARKLGADLDRLYHDRGMSLIRLGRREEALADFDRAIALDSRRYMLHFHRGGLLMMLRRYPEAEASYTRSIQLNPRFSIAFILRARSYRLQRKYDEAEADLRIAVKLPDPYEAEFDLARLLAARGKLGEAHAFALQAKRRKPAEREIVELEAQIRRALASQR